MIIDQKTPFLFNLSPNPNVSYALTPENAPGPIVFSWLSTKCLTFFILSKFYKFLLRIILLLFLFIIGIYIGVSSQKLSEPGKIVLGVGSTVPIVILLGVLL